MTGVSATGRETRCDRRSYVVLLSLFMGTASAAVADDHRHHAESAPCTFTPAADENDSAPGLIIGAEILLPEGSRANRGAHVRFNGGLGAVGKFDAVRAAFPGAAVLDCRGAAVLSPGFVNAHEHPGYSYAFPDAGLNSGYVHRDGWRLGTNGALQLPIPERIDYRPGDPRSAAILLAMELRHLLGGATAIAGPGGLPGAVRNIYRHRRPGDIELYDYEADVEVFPFSFQVVEDLREECAGGPVHPFEWAAGDDLTFMAYVPHVGEGRKASCAARAEVARYLRRVQRRDRRYSLVHGVATDREDYAVMRGFDVTLVWSPRSNLALYGETVDIAGALDSGVRIALSTDWSPSGSFNMREEVACARRAASAAGVALSADALWRMSTVNGAYALGLEDRFGAIQAGLAGGPDPCRACWRESPRRHADGDAPRSPGGVGRRPRHPAVGVAAGVARCRGVCHAQGYGTARLRRAVSFRPLAVDVRRACRGNGAGKRCQSPSTLRRANAPTDTTVNLTAAGSLRHFMPTATHVWRAMRDITEEERRHYHHHGVVHLPDFLDDDWIGRLEAAFAEEMAALFCGPRERVLADFRSGAAPILVATNVAARGLDVEGVDRVINYDLSDSHQLFTHRVGRTGRMGRSGEAITFVTPDEARKWREIERGLGCRFARESWRAASEADAA